MTKKEKIKVLVQYINPVNHIEEDFKKKIATLPLIQSEENQAIIRKAILDRFQVHLKKYEEAQVDVYDLHFSEGAVNQSIAFYTTTAGEEIISKMPLIEEELHKNIFLLQKATFNDMMNIVDEYDEDDSTYED